MDAFSIPKLHELADFWRIWVKFMFLHSSPYFQCPLLFPKTLFQQVCILSSSVVRRQFRLYSSKFLVGCASPWEGCFLSFTLLVQFNSFIVPCEIFSIWRLKSSVLFILAKSFNLRAARNKNIASLLSSHECFLKKLDSLFRQLLSLFVTLFK